MRRHQEFDLRHHSAEVYFFCFIDPKAFYKMFPGCSIFTTEITSI